MIITKKNLIFIHIPKTGGNSISHILKKYSDDKLIKHRPYSDLINTFEIKGDVTKTKHDKLEDYYKILKDKIFNFKVFCVVRDPLERLLSHYYMPDLNVHPNFILRKINHFTIKRFNKFFFGSKYYKYKKPKFDIQKFRKIINTADNQKSFITIKNEVPKNVKILKFKNFEIELKNFCRENNIVYNNFHVNKGGQYTKFDLNINELKKEITNSKHFVDYELL